ncbi:unnamed protein product [Amoebophrya sp. A120]|nr:unnamed protein product [Amoebophrya sp. A120]|eukprot:GSA120T00011414001.1
MGGEESKEEEPPAPPEPEPQRQSRRSARQSSGKQEDRPSAQERLSQAYQTKHSRLQSAKESVIERQSQKAAQAEKARATAENNFRGSRRRPKRPSEDVDYEQQEPGSYNASTPSSRGPGSSARGVGSAMGSARQQMGSGMGSARQMGSQMGSGSVRGMGSGMGSGMNNNLGSGSSPAGAAGASVRLSNSPNSSSKQVRASSGPGSSAEKVRLSGERQRLSSEKPPFLAGQGAAPRLSSGGGFASGETKKINSGAMMGSLQPQSLTELQSAEAKRVSFVEAVRASTKDELRLGSGMGSGTMDQAAVEERLPSSLHELPQQAPPNVMHLAADSQEQQVRMGTQDPNITSFAPTSAAMHAPPMQSFAMGGPPSMASSVPSMMQQMQSFQLGSTAQVGGGSGDFVMSNMGSSGGSGGGVASGGGVGSGGGVPLMVNHRGDVYDGGNNKKLTITKDRRGGNVDPRELNSDMPAAAPGSGFGDPMQSTGSGGNEPVAPGELPTLDIEDGDQDERTLITEKPPVIVMVQLTFSAEYGCFLF